MSRPVKVTQYDAFMLESFQMGKNANEVFNAINFQQINKKEKPIVPRMTVYRAYWRWERAGKPGELELVEVKREDGEVIAIWREKQRQTAE